MPTAGVGSRSGGTGSPAGPGTTPASAPGGGLTVRFTAGAAAAWRAEPRHPALAVAAALAMRAVSRPRRRAGPKG